MMRATTAMASIEAGSRVSLGAADRVAVIAGSGRLTEIVIESLALGGKAPFVVIVEGEAPPSVARSGSGSATLALERIGSLVPMLRRERVTHIVMAGGIGRRPAWWAIRPTWSLLAIAARVFANLARGDDAALSTGVRILEEEGFRVVGAHEVVPDLLAAEGLLGAVKPKRVDRSDLDAAFAAAKAIGELDIGQAAVSIGGRVIAVEGIEGTDGLLERVRSLRGHGRIAAHKRGVLVKCAKPGQELRADLPAIGPATIENAHAAGLVGIGVEAGRSLVLDQMAVVQRADALGLFVVGIPRGPA